MSAKETVRMNLDDLTLQKHAAIYPEEMREPFMWLGGFVREQCLRDMDVLMLRLRELGITHDKTTWSKILRGKWNRDSAERVLTVPILALPKFLSIIERLKDDERVRETAGRLPFVKTPTATMIWDYIDAHRAPERINRFGVIVGYTGTQKTASLKAYQREHNHGLCTWQEAPENGSLKEFLRMLSFKYGGSAGENYDDARKRVFRTVGSRHTIMVDNAQAMYKPSRDTDQPVFNLLRRLQDERECTVILSITPEFHKKLGQQMMQGYFEQFEGRAGGRRNFLELPDYPTEDDVMAFAGAFKLRDAEKHLEFLMKLAQEPGRVRILLETLQEAKRCSEEEKEPLTIKWVKAAAGE